MTTPTTTAQPNDALAEALRGLVAMYDPIGEDNGTWGPEQPLWDAAKTAIIQHDAERLRAKKELRIKIVRNDNLPAFGGYCWKESGHDDEELILLNVEACLGGLADEDGRPVNSTTEEKKYILITTLMHEFGHALEHYFKTGPNEESIEDAIKSWAAKEEPASAKPTGAQSEDSARLDWLETGSSPLDPLELVNGKHRVTRKAIDAARAAQGEKGGL